VWSRSLDDRFTDFQSAKEADLNGFVWGTKWQCLYPGLTIVRGSPEAGDWTKNLGIPFHEVLIETNVHNIRLVFAELAVEDIDVGYTPYTVVHDEPIHVDREDMGEAADWKW
jgi:hypothetical protein